MYLWLESSSRTGINYVSGNRGKSYVGRLVVVLPIYSPQERESLIISPLSISFLSLPLSVSSLGTIGVIMSWPRPHLPFVILPDPNSRNVRLIEPSTPPSLFSSLSGGGERELFSFRSRTQMGKVVYFLTWGNPSLFLWLESSQPIKVTI